MNGDALRNGQSERHVVLITNCMRTVSAATEILEQHELPRCHAALLAVGCRDLDDAAHAEHELTPGRHVPVLDGAGLELCKHDAFEIAESIHEQALLRGGTATGGCQYQAPLCQVGGGPG